MPPPAPPPASATRVRVTLHGGAAPTPDPVVDRRLVVHLLEERLRTEFQTLSRQVGRYLFLPVSLLAAILLASSFAGGALSRPLERVFTTIVAVGAFALYRAAARA